MDWQRFFLILFLIPTFTYGFNEKECSQIQLKITFEWDKHNEYVQQFQALETSTDTEKALPLLKDAVQSCERAIRYCDQLLNDIAQRSKKEASKSWRVKLKETCEQYQKALLTELTAIRSVILKIEGDAAITKANTLYNQSLEKGYLVSIKKNALRCSLSNSDEVINVLNEISNDYTAIVTDLHTALDSIAPYPNQEENESTLKSLLGKYEKLAFECKQEAENWPTCIQNQMTLLRGELISLKAEAELFRYKGLDFSCYQTQKEILIILEELIKHNSAHEHFRCEWEETKNQIDSFEQQLHSHKSVNHFIDHQLQEKERRALFYKHDPLLEPQSDSISSSSNIIPLDGQQEKNGIFTLYTEQFYRFLFKQNTPVSTIAFEVYEDNQLIYTETVELPCVGTRGWEQYLKSGMLFVPETRLQSEFGFDLRFHFVFNSNNDFSVVISQKGSNPHYHLITKLDELTLYQARFQVPPPWQLEMLRMPQESFRLNSFVPTSASIQLPLEILPSTSQKKPIVYSALDQLVKELNNDPMAIAEYVQHEIAFVDPFRYQENGVFQAATIHRNPYVTFMEQQGSAWEQCQLLVYLLQKAGYQAHYGMADYCLLPKDFVERLLFTQVSSNQEEVQVKYPWVVFFDGDQWISLFPWMKEIEMHEGYDLYQLLPKEYASAELWTLQYLKGDPEIVKYIGADGDDSAGILFVRFLEDHVQKQGFSIQDVGIQRRELKRSFASWNDFPHPKVSDQITIFSSLDKIPNLFALITIELSAHNNLKSKWSQTYRLADFGCETSSIRFTNSGEKESVHFYPSGSGVSMGIGLSPDDALVDIKINYCDFPACPKFYKEQTFSIARGTTAAVCFDFGDAQSKRTTELHRLFSKEKNEDQRVAALLSFVGAVYFEKCNRATQALACLHKIPSPITFAFGLSKFTPRGNDTYPQVDMFYFQNPSDEQYNAFECSSLVLLDSSSNEHQVLRDVFKDPYAVSTVRLLQIAHQEKGGFLTFTPESFKRADETPEAAQSIHFSHIKDLNLRDLPNRSPGQWELLKKMLRSDNSLSQWSLAYVTPGLISSKNDTYQEMGALIFSPYMGYALISNNNLVFNGGLGSALPGFNLTTDWQLIPDKNGYRVNYTRTQASLFPINMLFPSQTPVEPDVRNI